MSKRQNCKMHMAHKENAHRETARPKSQQTIKYQKRRNSKEFNRELSESCENQEDCVEATKP